MAYSAESFSLRSGAIGISRHRIQNEAANRTSTTTRITSKGQGELGNRFCLAFSAFTASYCAQLPVVGFRDFPYIRYIYKVLWRVYDRDVYPL